MSDSANLEKAIELAEKLSPLERIRLIERLTPQLKRDLAISSTQPRRSLRGIWRGLEIGDRDLAEVKSEMSDNFPREDI